MSRSFNTPEDDNDDTPTPLNFLPNDGGDDDDEPPAAGAALILEADEESEHGLTLSKAPTAEPEHRVSPNRVVTA